MDLIYMNPGKEDIGVLNAYEFDLAFGKDENDFMLNISKHVCGYGYYIYIEGTEYGGVIDSINVDTSSDSVIYSGRTWHGILEGKIIFPDDGMDYLTLNGEANEVLAELITRMDLDDLFEASTEDSGIIISQYDCNRYIPGYSCIRKMLAQFYGKLKIEYVEGKVRLSAIPRIDYSNDEEFDSSQVQFSITKNNRPTNHLVCLGSGELSARHVIHLFADANGGIQPFKRKEQPIEDADYILDTSQQVLFCDDEVAEVYDYPNANSIANYVLLAEEDKPSEWDSVFNQYYERKENEYKQLESWQENVYTDLTKQPYDWADNYGSYYTLNSSGEYVSVESVSEAVYTVQSTPPSNWNSKFSIYFVKDGTEYKPVEAELVKTYKLLDVCNGWKENYSNYFYYYSDGTVEEYRKVSSETAERFNLQSMQPTDWETNFGNYYMKNAANNGFEKVVAIGVNDPKYVLQKSSPDDWKKNYQNYYYYYSDGTTSEYRKVSGISKDKYVLQTQQPSDWETNCTSYYVKNGSTYDQVAASTKTTYEALNTQPSNWNSTYTNYFTKSLDGKSYVKVPAASTAPAFRKGTYYKGTSSQAAPKWKKSKYYTKQNYSVAPSWEKSKYYTKENPKVPAWEKGKYYTRETYSVAPAFEANHYYECIQTDVAPAWNSGKYYTQSINNVPSFVVGNYFRMTVETMHPEWRSNKYYRKAIDNFADLVNYAIEKMKDAIDCDELEIDFNSDDANYDIGDIVGANDNTTGLSLWQPITKKIVKIKNNLQTISYEVGE